MTEGCFFKLVISLKEILRLTLPMLGFSTLLSSLTIFCVLGRGLGFGGTTAPALKVRSERNESLSDANLRKAFSKSTSLSPPVLLIWTALIVALLLLLSVPFFSEPRLTD